MTEIIEVVDGNHRKKVQTAVWQRSGLIDPKEPVLSVRRQCELLNVHRSCVYYRSKPTQGLNHGKRPIRPILTRINK